MSLLIKKIIPDKVEIVPSSKLQKKVIVSDTEHQRKIIERYVRVYHSRLGSIRYLVMFLCFPSTNKGKQGIYITDEEINGIPYGEWNSVRKSNIKGTLLTVEEIPEKILNLIKRELRYGKYL